MLRGVDFFSPPVALRLLLAPALELALALPPLLAACARLALPEEEDEDFEPEEAEELRDAMACSLLVSWMGVRKAVPVADCKEPTRGICSRAHPAAVGPHRKEQFYFQAARARARTCISGGCGCAGEGRVTIASGHATCSKCGSIASAMKRVRPAYRWRSPPPDCCET